MCGASRRRSGILVRASIGVAAGFTARSSHEYLIACDYPILRADELQGQALPLRPRNHLGESRLLQHAQVVASDRLPALVERAGGAVRAGRQAQDATGPAAEVLDRLDHVEQGDISGVAGEAEAAAESFLRLEQPELG